MATPRTVAFHTLGCKLNFSETSSIKRQFEQAGYAVGSYEEGADVFVINTCSVTDFADKKCRYEVRRALRHSPDAKVVVVGCYAQLKPQEIAEIPGVDLVLGAAEKFNIVEHIDGLIHSTGKGLVEAGDISDVNHFVSTFSISDRTRSFLKVQDGCDYKCSFCTIPLARGKSRSATVAQVLAQTREIGNRGVKEIVLTGINLGDFGNGTEVIEGKRPVKEGLFFDLIRALEDQGAVDRYRISSIEPNLLTDEIIELVTQSRRFMPHFHLPLQSGSPKILKSMRRRYTRELYRNRVEKIKDMMPHACIGVDVIVGYPGESEEHFQETYHFLHELDVSYLHVFTYSERTNTVAATMNQSVDMAIRKTRNRQLRNLSHKKKTHFYQKNLGSIRPALMEGKIENGFRSGFTDNYIPIILSAETTLENELLNAMMNSYDGQKVHSEKVHSPSHIEI